ncbi:MAG TPA: flippase-like domain-containing protein, partial [Spirochaetes bacterium]|nr:flippase-like domain-containing protein [Spirochaetota bacterium]
MPVRKILKFDRATIVRRLMILIVIGVVLNVVITFFTTDTGRFMELVRFSPPCFLLAVGLSVVPWFTHALRLYNWLGFIGHALPYRSVLRIIIASELGAAISPTALGNGPVKVGLLSERGVPVGKSVSLTLLHSIEDYGFFALAVPLGISYSAARFDIFDRIADRTMDITFWVVVLALGVIASIAITRRFITNSSRMKGVKSKLGKVWKDFKGIYVFVGKKGKGRFCVNVLLAGLQWTAKFSVITALTASLGFDINVIQFFVLQWVVFIMSTFIPTPGAIGGAETSFLIVF